MHRIFILSSAVALMLGGTAFGQQPANDQQFAQQLWQQLASARMVGENAIRTHPYEGQEPHGAILQYLEAPVTVGGREGRAIVKNNYVGENVSVERVWAGDPALQPAVTVMFKREAGYNPEHGDWFWAKYNPDGSVDVAGQAEGCINCHEGAPGQDYIFSFNR